ncbi:hypothetical protein CQW23_33269 [Capsicum baccatum]|uniref:Uncharacterized protein n=1 Tax=Capsicum baccatum TaxID=33114 RepID=A0A2G2V2A6_CAPBA|nr:hypothetical protein CQW23_33269 [Capsicum baccatum]
MNNFSGTIPPEIGNLTNLVYLDLNSNQISDTIPSQIGSLVKLQILRIFDNHLNGPVPGEVAYLRNNLKGKILQCLGNISGLQYVMMSHHNLNGELPSSICNLTSLQVLDMGRNNLIGAMPQCFGNMSGHLELEGKIPRSLETCKLVEVLDLGDNLLNDTFPMWLGTLLELRVLNLIEAMTKIDPSKKTRSDERYGYYYENSIAVVTKGLELQVVSILILYITISLSNNKFGGHIPSIIGDLIALCMLNLSNNGLQGHIMPSLGRFEEVIIQFGLHIGKTLRNQKMTQSVRSESPNLQPTRHRSECMPPMGGTDYSEYRLMQENFAKMDHKEKRIYRRLDAMSIPDPVKFMEEFKQAQTNIAELKSKQPQKPIFYLALVINDEDEGIVDLLGETLKDKGKKVVSPTFLKIPRAIWNPPLTRRGSPQPEYAARVGVSDSDTPQDI